MMKPLFPLALCLLLLCGCAAQSPIPEAQAESASLSAQAPDTISAIGTDGAIRRWHLPEDTTGVLPMGQNLLVFRGSQTTTLTLVDPETMSETARWEAGFLLLPTDSTLRIWEDGLSFYDPASGQTLVLDAQLAQKGRIPKPDGLQGAPLLSQDLRTLYYCTADAIRAFDLSSGIHRIVKEGAYPEQTLSGLLLEDSVLQVSITDAEGLQRTLFLSAKTGQLLQSCDGAVSPMTAGDAYLVCMAQSSGNTLLFGRADGAVMQLQPKAWETAILLGSRFQALTAGASEDGLRLDCYDLETGRRTASVTVPGNSQLCTAGVGTDGRIWLMCTQDDAPALLSWDSAASQVTDDAIYTSPQFTRKEPDYDGLAACSVYAQELGEKYGIEVRIYRDAVAQKPWDYTLEYEYQTPVLRRELEQLDQALASFPEGFLAKLTQKLTALRICIVRSATGTPASGSLSAVNGLQFREGTDAYIILCADQDTRTALYHELFHLIDTVVLTSSTAYDRWDTLNPPDFQYDNDYLANRNRDGSAWLTPGEAYFVDTYSMSFAKEDRARIFENAATDGHAQLFAAPVLQAKLKLLCTGIRDAFGLKNSPDTFVWEQYLLNN